MTERLRKAGVRAQTDEQNEKLGYKFRLGETKKLPYLLVVGEKEAQEDKVAVRKRKEGDQGSMTVAEFATKIKAEIETRA